MTLTIYKDVVSRIPSGRLRQLFVAIAVGENQWRKPGCINLVFVSPDKIRSLNARWRGKDYVTDVLSFVINEATSENEVFGEVYICGERAREQARQYKGSLTSEYLRLACHGFLHLFGYDHTQVKDARIMREKEVRYLKGITEVYY